MTTLNSSQSAYASFRLDKNLFFESYDYNVGQVQAEEAKKDVDARFTCQLYNKV